MDFWSSLWNIIVVFFWAFVFLAALTAMVTVVVDLVRDKSLSGWAKAGWVVFLVLLPLVASLVYLIARGDGMAERTQGENRAAKQATDEYIRSVARRSPADEIARAAELRGSGVIDEEEFQQLKRQALATPV